MAGLPWFRYHADVLDNKRVQKLPPELFKLWVNCQCILTQESVGASGKLPPIDDCAFRLRMSVEETVGKFGILVDAGLLVKRIETKCNDNETENETKSTVSSPENGTLIDETVYSYFVKNWSKKQYKSDTSTERVQRFRKRSKSVTETPPESDQIRTESETESEEDGSFHSKNFDKEEKRRPTSYNIDIFLKDDARAQARASSQGWDQQALMRSFNEFIVGKSKEFPRHPGKAYVSWVKKYTKGKPPT